VIGDGSGGRDRSPRGQLGGEAERREQSAHGVGLGHRAENPARPSAAVTHEATADSRPMAIGATH